MLSIENISQFQKSQNVQYCNQWNIVINNTMRRCSWYNVIIINAKWRIYLNTLIGKKKVKGKAEKWSRMNTYHPYNLKKISFFKIIIKINPLEWVKSWQARARPQRASSHSRTPSRWGTAAGLGQLLISTWDGSQCFANRSLKVLLSFSLLGYFRGHLQGVAWKVSAGSSVSWS